MSFEIGDTFFVPADEEHVKREKKKAKELRNSQWWKNLRGRGQCYYCKARVPPKELTLDHIVPVIRGGRSTKGNLVACCKECNNKKKYLLPLEWQEYLDHLAKPSVAEVPPNRNVED
jgi:5-methylcytosine-specific restriction endonuclease McrA